MTLEEIEEAEAALEPWAAAMHRMATSRGLALNVVWPDGRWQTFGSLPEVRAHLAVSDTRTR